MNFSDRDTTKKAKAQAAGHMITSLIMDAAQAADRAREGGPLREIYHSLSQSSAASIPYWIGVVKKYLG